MTGDGQSFPPSITGKGSRFPAGGSGNNGRGAYAAYVHFGGDVGYSNSWGAGISYLGTKSLDRTTCIDTNTSCTTADTDTFTGNNKLLIADLVWKWAPNGNDYGRDLLRLHYENAPHHRHQHKPQG